MVALFDALKVEKVGVGSYQAQLHEDWIQGGGVYGGLQCALFLTVFDVLVDPQRRARKISVQFCAPAKAGKIKIFVREEKQGRHVSHLAARMVGENGTIAIAAATYASARSSEFDRDALSLPLSAKSEDFAPQVHQPIIPVFAKHFEFRFTRGDLFQSRSDKAEVAGFIRSRDPISASPALLAALMDAWPPAFFATLAEPRATASSDFMIQFLAPIPDGSEQFWYESQTLWVNEGYAEEDAVLATTSGLALARIRQTRVIF